MKSTRISFLTFMCSILCLNLWGSGEANRLKDHPRLFINNQRVEELKKQTDEVSILLKEIILHQADEAMLLPPVVYPVKEFKMGAVRETQRRVLCLSMSYLLTDKECYLSAAKEVLMRLSALDDWGTNHFLDVGEAAFAAGVGLDWLYDKLSPEEKQTITRAIVVNGLRPALTERERDDKSSWVNGDFNWNPVCHGGITVAALAIAEVEPQLSRQIIDRAVKNIPIYATAFEPDGSDAEGPSYWSYGAVFYIMSLEALRTATGTSYGLDRFQGFLKSGDYNNQVTGVTGVDYNYSDYHDERLNEPVMLWFGRELQRYDLVQREIKDIRTMYKQFVKKATNPYSPKRSPSRHIPLELVWWEPELSEKGKSVSPLHYTARGGLPLGITRSSWTDPRASFIAIKGGTPNHSHGHMDVGSFILEANGVRWALDLGTENYNKMRAAKLDLWNYAQNSNRWTTFRVGPEGHNILRFDGAYQNIEGYASIEPLTQADGSVGHRVDLSTLYSGKAGSVQRSVLLHSDGTVSVCDEWATVNPSTIVSWQLLTKAEVTQTDDGLLLRQNGESLALRIESAMNLQDLKIRVEDKSEPANMQDSPNPGLKSIVIEIPVDKMQGKFHIKAIPGQPD